MQREYVAIAKNAVQISPDDFEVRYETLKVTDDTTIGQIREWYLTHFFRHEKDKDKVAMTGIRISQLAIPEPPKPSQP